MSSPGEAESPEAIKLDGKVVAEEILAELAARVEHLADRGVTPGLGTILVGDDAPSHRYVQMKHDDCARLGIASFGKVLAADATQSEVLAAVEEFNADPAVDAFITQVPMPDQIDEGTVLAAIEPRKDADGLHPTNLGWLVQAEQAPRPCTPVGIQRLLSHYDVPVEGQNVVIVGRGLTIGRPLANLLSLKEPNANAAVTVVHTGVSDLATYTAAADVLIAAAGSPHMITPEMVKPGAAVVAAGVTFDENGKVVSDVAPGVEKVAGWLSPKVGGVGPLTRAMLLSNAVAAAEAGLDG